MHIMNQLLTLKKHVFLAVKFPIIHFWTNNLNRFHIFSFKNSTSSSQTKLEFKKVVLMTFFLISPLVPEIKQLH